MSIEALCIISQQSVNSENGVIFRETWNRAKLAIFGQRDIEILQMTLKTTI